MPRFAETLLTSWTEETVRERQRRTAEDQEGAAP